MTRLDPNPFQLYPPVLPLLLVVTNYFIMLDLDERILKQQQEEEERKRERREKKKEKVSL